MQVSKRLVEYMQNIDFKLFNSNFLMSDLNEVLYTTMTNMDDCYWHKKLSLDVKELAEEWKSRKFSDDLFLILNNDLKQIIENDSTKYSAQMFFPIFINKKMDGFVIFFRTKGDYILSSAKAPKTVKNFIERYLNEEN